MMRRIALGAAVLVGLCVAYVPLHLALIEVGREVVVLRTRTAEGDWNETRLWVVDDGGAPWVHGGNSSWMRQLEADPRVEMVRGGETRTYRAQPVPEADPRIHALLREKYGFADRWVRLLTGYVDCVPVRLEPV